MKDLREFLKQNELFSDLQRAEVEELAALFGHRTYQRRQAIYLPGDPPDGIYLVAAGTVKIARLSPDGKEVTLRLVGPGQVFGELALLDDAPREDLAEAFDATTAYHAARRDLERFLRRHPAVALGVARLIGRRLREAEAKVEQLAFKGLPARLATLLVQLAQDYGHLSQEGIRVALPMAHQDLASQVASSRESTTIALNTFKRQGLIDLAPRRITIKDLRQLQAIG